MPTPSQPHSAEQFGAQRDFWWHRDFLDLMATRWRLREASSLADIGCGLCHWSRLLYPYLRAPARFAGVDRESRWVAEAPHHFRRAFPQLSADLLSFQQGDATRLPLPDNTFEVVTCQTVLMHLPQPLDALREIPHPPTGRTPRLRRAQQFMELSALHFTEGRRAGRSHCPAVRILVALPSRSNRGGPR